MYHAPEFRRNHWDPFGCSTNFGWLVSWWPWKLAAKVRGLQTARERAGAAGAELRFLVEGFSQPGGQTVELLAAIIWFPISTGTTRTLLKCSLSLKSHNSKEFVNTLSYPLNWVPRFVQLKKRQHETDFRTCQWCSNNFNKTDITLSMDDSWPGRPKARGACGQSLCFLQWTGALWKGELVH